MSSAGISTSQLTPELLQQIQQYQEQQKQQAMAQSLMQNNAPMGTPYAGISNAGSSLSGAMMAKAMQRNAMQQAQNNAPGTMMPLGGGLGSVSSKTPNLPNQPSWMSNLFSLGGGS